MTRSDILLDTNKTVRRMEDKGMDKDVVNHVLEMADILEDFWSVMLTFEKHEDFSKMGSHMRKIFYRENK